MDATAREGEKDDIESATGSETSSIVSTAWQFNEFNREYSCLEGNSIDRVGTLKSDEVVVFPAHESLHTPPLALSSFTLQPLRTPQTPRLQLLLL